MNTIELMTTAYQLMFEIETKLRTIIKTHLIDTYGPYWVSRLNEKRSEEDSYYHELVAFFGKYPHVIPHFTDLCMDHQNTSINPSNTVQE